ncbi:MAG: metallophosphoesterase family protein [Chloroflexi bacterium]|nr:metallophosphoesterase family protein [Chloroflexota bacterium]
MHQRDEAEVWGLISDVHGNFPALDAAIAVLAAAGARRLAFLGDYLGRGDADRCVQRIKEVADLAIVGNRDLDWQDRVSATSKAFVRSLPKTAQSGKLLISHGDPRLTPSLSTTQIGRGFLRVWPEMEQRHAQVWAFGHSHHARIWRDGALQAPTCVSLDDSARYCLNVGTTGLPFPGKGGPSVAVVDFARAQIRQIALDRV